MPEDDIGKETSAFWGSSLLPLLVKSLIPFTGLVTDTIEGDKASTANRAFGWITEKVEGGLDVGRDWIKDQVRALCGQAGLDKEGTESVISIIDMILPRSVLGALTFPLVAAVVIAGVVTNVTSQVGGKVGRHTAGLIKPALPGMDVLLRAIWRNPNERDFRDLMRQTGLGDREQWALNTGSMPILEMPELSRLLAMGHIGNVDFLKRLGNLGWSGLLSENSPTSTGRRMIRLAHPIVSPAELSELYRRGKISPDVYRTRLGFAGLFTREREWHVELAKRMPDPNVLLDLCRRGRITQETLRGGLKKHGFDEPTLNNLETLWQRFVEPFDLRELYWRGFTDKKRYTEGLMRHGYSQDDANDLVKLAEVFPTVTDVVRFAVREVYTPEIAEEFGQYEDFPTLAVPDAQRIGLTEAELKKYWASHWALPSFMQGADLLHRGKLEPHQLIKLARALDIMPFWQKKMIQLTFRLIPRRTLPQLVKYADVSPEEMTLRYGYLGYNAEDAALLSRIAVARAFEAEKTLTKAELRDGFVSGLININELRTELDRLGYSKTAINYHVQKAVQRRRDEALKERQEQIDEAEKLARQLTKAELLKGYREGMIDAETTIQALLGMGYSELSAAFFVQYEQLRRDREVQEAMARQHKRLFDAYLVTDSETIAALTSFGYAVPETERLIKAWSVERNADERLAASRTHKASRATLERWVKMGLVGVDEWVEGMETLNYTDRQIDLHLQEIATELIE